MVTRGTSANADEHDDEHDYGSDPQHQPQEQLDPRHAGADRRLERICQYADEALSHPDCCQANLGAINGDLMMMAYRLRQSLDDAMETGSGDWQQLLEGMNMLLRVDKQVERYVQLDLRLQQSSQEAQRFAETIRRDESEESSC